MLGLSKVVPGVAVKRHLAKGRDGNVFLRHDLGGVENIKAEAELISLIHDLHTKLQAKSAYTRILGGLMGLDAYLPLGEPTLLNRLEQILAVEVGVLTGSDLSLLPGETSLALKGLPVELDELGGTIVSDKTEGVHAETVHVAEGPDDAVLSHGPEKGVQGARLLAEEVPGAVMSSCRLRDFAVRRGLDSVNQIREKNSVLNEENRDVVANNVCSYDQ